MPSTYSTNLALELIGTGDQAGTWGNTTNTNLGTLIEQAISGYVTQAVATGTDTTITIPNGATGVARNMYIELTGTGGTNTNLIVPSNKKLYFIFNNSTGAVTVKVSGQTGVSVPQGKKVVLVSNGTDIVNGLNYIADFGTNSFTVTNLTATSATITTLTGTSAGITTLSSGSANITQLNSTSASITTLTGTSANITTLSGTTATFTSASVTNLALTSVTLSNLNIASANITTLTSSSATISTTLALSGGTANGVLYLNGSKVATSGSALTFDGSALDLAGASLQRLGFYNSSAATDEKTYAWQSGSAIGNGVLRLRLINDANSDGVNAYVIDRTGTSIDYQAWSAATTEAMRLTSTGLGIGTSSPAYKLHVTGTQRIEKSGAGYEAAMLSFSTLSETGAIYRMGMASGGAFIIGRSDTATTNLTLDVSGNLGIGTSSPGAKLDVAGTGNASLFRINNATTGKAGMVFANNGTTAGLVSLSGLFEGDSSTDISLVGESGVGIRFYTNGSATEKAVIDVSGNLGIGTSSPTYKLDLSVTTNNGIRTTSSAGQQSYLGNTGGEAVTGTLNNYGFGIITNGSIRGYFDASGNLGIGTSSPTNYGATYKTLAVNGSSTGIVDVMQNGTVYGQLSTEANVYKVEAVGASTVLRLVTNSATRATLDSSGNLGLGVTPSAWSGFGKTMEFNNAGCYIGNSGATVMQVGANNYFDGSNYIYSTSNVATRYAQNSGQHQFFTAASGTAGNAITFTQAMTLDASGRLGIGTTSPAQPLHVDASGGGVVRVTRLGTSATAYGQLENDGTNSSVTTTGALIFNTGSSPAERARITAGGAFCVGSTDYATAIVLAKSTAASTSVYNSWNSATSGTRYHFEFRDDAGATSRGSITTDGANTAYNTSSDRRLKQNIIPCADAGMVIDGIEVVEFDWKSGSHTRFGMIAQDLHLVAPEAVKTGDDGEEVTDAWGVDYSKLVPMLVKEIQSLRARVAQLEAK